MRPFGERRDHTRLERTGSRFLALAREWLRCCAQSGVVTRATGSGKSEMELTSDILWNALSSHLDREVMGVYALTEDQQ